VVGAALVVGEVALHLEHQLVAAPEPDRERLVVQYDGHRDALVQLARDRHRHVALARAREQVPAAGAQRQRPAQRLDPCRREPRGEAAVRDLHRERDRLGLLVGRQGELARLDAGRQQARDGERPVVLPLDPRGRGARSRLDDHGVRAARAPEPQHAAVALPQLPHLLLGQPHRPHGGAAHLADVPGDALLERRLLRLLLGFGVLLGLVLGILVLVAVGVLLVGHLHGAEQVAELDPRPVGTRGPVLLGLQLVLERRLVAAADHL
jgi:hypothetical protein